MQQGARQPVMAQEDAEAAVSPRVQRARRVALPLAWAAVLAVAFGAGSQLSFSVNPTTLSQAEKRVLQLAELERLMTPYSGAPQDTLREGGPDTLSQAEYEQQLVAEQQLLNDVKQLMRNKDYPRARQKLLDCIDKQPASADCHKLLATVYAKVNEPERGYTEYREFLRYAPPSHPDYGRVAAIVESYEHPW